LVGKPPFTAEGYNELIFHICGRPPPPIESLASGFPDGLTAALQSGLAQRKEDRATSMRAFHDALVPFQSFTGALALTEEGTKHVGPMVTEQPPAMMHRLSGLLADAESLPVPPKKITAT